MQERKKKEYFLYDIYVNHNNNTIDSITNFNLNLINNYPITNR